MYNDSLIIFGGVYYDSPVGYFVACHFGAQIDHMHHIWIHLTIWISICSSQAILKMVISKNSILPSNSGPDDSMTDQKNPAVSAQKPIRVHGLQTAIFCRFN